MASQSFSTDFSGCETHYCMASGFLKPIAVYPLPGSVVQAPLSSIQSSFTTGYSGLRPESTVLWPRHVCSSYIVLPFTGCCILLWSTESPFQSQLIFPLCGIFLHVGNLSFPPGFVGSYFVSSSFCITLLWSDFPCPLRCLKSSTSVQQVLYENCSKFVDVCLMYLWREKKFCIFLFFHLDCSLTNLFFKNRESASVIIVFSLNEVSTITKKWSADRKIKEHTHTQIRRTYRVKE